MQDDRQVSPLRSRIVDSACRAFASQGYAGTSVRQVALDAGTTKPMIYYYFGSKSGLFRSVHEELAARAAKDIAVAAPTHGSPSEKLIALLAATLAQRTADPEAFAFLGRARREPVAEPGEHSGTVDTRLIAQHDALGRILDEGVAAGELRPVDPALFDRWFVNALDLFELEPVPSVGDVAQLLLRGLGNVPTSRPG